MESAREDSISPRGGEPAKTEDAPDVAAASQASEDGLLCPFCQGAVGAGEASAACSTCHTAYHQECWEANEGCALYGCAQAPETIKWTGAEIPVSYWGVERKCCPSCNGDILASALRCKHCGAVFKSAAPSSVAAYSDLQDFQRVEAKLRRRAYYVFFGNVVPGLGLIALFIGAIWMLINRKRIRRLPSFYRTLCYLGIGVGVGQIVIVAIATLLHYLQQSYII